jgi:methionine transaminase
MTPEIKSLFCTTKLNIFTHMSVLANTNNAVNLGQGFPDFDGPEVLKELVMQAIKDGKNQYAPMPGVLDLRRAISRKIQRDYGRSYDAETEITVTAGASFALFATTTALTRPGDEFIVLEPCFDMHQSSVTIAGGTIVPVQLNQETYRPDFDAIERAMTNKTRAIIINTPHNPSGTIWTEAEMLRLQEILEPTNVILISDEVYEHMVYDDATHQSVTRFPKLAERAFVITSFGKTFHMTGWKTGYVAAPKSYTSAIRAILQGTIFSVHTPMQHGLAKFLLNDEYCQTLPAFFQQKRDFFRDGLRKTKFRILPSEGTYFQCVDYSDYSSVSGDMDDLSFCEWLCQEHGVAAIPLSPFYVHPTKAKIIRFCFGKNQKTLEQALVRLQKI